VHNSVIAVIGIDIGKNSLHVVGLDGRGAITLRQKWSRGQVENPARAGWAASRLPDGCMTEQISNLRPTRMSGLRRD